MHNYAGHFVLFLEWSLFIDVSSGKAPSFQHSPEQEIDYVESLVEKHPTILKTTAIALLMSNFFL